MTPYETLSAQDQEAIASYIRHYASGNYYDGFLSLSKSLSYWNDAKQDYLYPLLGNNLTLSKSISIEITPQIVASKIAELHLTSSPFVQALTTRLREEVNPLEPLPAWYAALRSLFTNSDNLALGTYRGDSYSFTLNNQPFHLHKGERITKISHKLAEIYGLQDSYEPFRIGLSKATGEKVRESVLHLSIHPLDFMAMSDNNHGWTSCMRWRDEPGCYREGTLDCMNSPYALLAYLADEEDPMELPNGNFWNNKIWRELFIVHPELGIFGVKGYPYANAALESATVSWLRSLAEENLDWNFQNAEPIPYDNKGWNINENHYNLSINWDYMYDDTFTANTFHYACLLEGIDTCIALDLSGTVRCIICGDYLPENDNNSGMGVVCCDAHAGGNYCWNCGDRIHSSDGYEPLSNGEVVCIYCWENHAIYCPAQDEYCWDDDTVEVALVEDGCEYGDENWPTITFSYDSINYLDRSKFATSTAHRTPYGDYYLYASEVLKDATRRLW